MSPAQMPTGVMPGMPIADPNQVTTKPRQMPGDGGGAPGMGGGDNPFADDEGSDADGAAPDNGANNPSAGPMGDNQETQQAVAKIVRDVLASNPGLPVRRAIKIAAKAHHVAVAPVHRPDGPEGQGEPLPPSQPLPVPLRNPDSPMLPGKPGVDPVATAPYHHFGEDL